MFGEPSDPKDMLLNLISATAVNQSHAPGLALRPFGALMIKIADETGETVTDLKAHITSLNQANAKLQRWVVALAVAALLATIAQTFAALYPLRATGTTSGPPQVTPTHPPPSPARN